MIDIYERIEIDFTYHAPTDDKKALHESTRRALKNVAHQLAGNLPNCRETSLVLTKLEEAMFWANAAIARNE